MWLKLKHLIKGGQSSFKGSAGDVIAAQYLLVASEGLGLTVNQGGTAVILKCYAHL